MIRVPIPSRPALNRFLRFCLVGAAGFVADFGVLVALVRLAGLNPILAKALSFGVAVLVTFELNRRWAFGAARSRRRIAAFAAYLSVQGFGFLCNWAVFTAATVLLPRPFGNLVPAAVAASAAALVLNYLGAARLVFRPANP